MVYLYDKNNEFIVKYLTKNEDENVRNKIENMILGTFKELLCWILVRKTDEFLLRIRNKTIRSNSPKCPWVFHHMLSNALVNTYLVPEKIYERKQCLCYRTTFTHFDMCWMYIDARDINKIVSIDDTHAKILSK